ncbi:hypothetical protein [Spirillospora sp. CA-294931]|uniref:hypothetical protein n=1 Tax=Spirillospora sp. CA-294931 TaxID=3240042 RepID=UPI003D8E6FC0
MPYEIRIFCVSDRLSATEILERVLGHAADQGAPLWARDKDFMGDRYASAQVVQAGRERFGSLHLQVFGSSQLYSWSTIQEYGAHKIKPGVTPDAYALLTLPPGETDWGAVASIWDSFRSLWSVIAHDDGSGFDVDLDGLQGEDESTTPTHVEDELDVLAKNASNTVEGLILQGQRPPFVVALTLDREGNLSRPQRFDHPEQRMDGVIEKYRAGCGGLRGVAVSLVSEDKVETHVEHMSGHAMHNASRYLLRGRTRRKVVWLGPETRTVAARLW